MIFNSVTFIAFLLVVVPLFWQGNANWRQWLIFLASLTFYGFWKVEFLPLLLFSALVDFNVSRHMAAASVYAKKWLLAVSLVCNLGLLLFFKYLYFLHENLTVAVNVLGLTIPPLDMEIILPLGISFYTFQTLSYTIDVYRGHLKAEDKFLPYACFVMFFPQLIAGPVLRASEVLPQLKAGKSFSSHDFAVGFRRIIFGLFLKVVIADNIAPFVDEGFSSDVTFLGALDVWTLAFLFGFQIYFDFSAYSNIALGTARILGIQFPENFNFPYMASNPRDFWKRWHISLSSWIRDYLYLPLTGAKVLVSSESGLSASHGGLGSQVKQAKGRKPNQALFISWAIMGLWHGANWTFFIWGVYHATVIYIHRKLSKFMFFKVPVFLSLLVTLGVMMMSWIPFRAESVQHTIDLWSLVINPTKYFSQLGLRENSYIVALFLTIGFFCANRIKNFLFYDKSYSNSNFQNLCEICFFTILILLILIFLRPVSQFIYFQF